jgi:hypothetical protein
VLAASAAGCLRLTPSFLPHRRVARRRHAVSNAHAPHAQIRNGGAVLTKKFLIAWIVLFVVWMVGSFVIHGTLLRDDYMAMSSLFRPEADAGKYFPLMIFAHVLLAGAFAWIYQRGRENKAWLGQGVRFGIAVALLTVVPTYIIYYVVQPMPGATAVKQIVFDGCLIIILGAVAAFMFKEPV